MNIEYEATFAKVDKEDVRQRLKKVGAELLRPEFLQKRIALDLPEGNEIKGAWLRVRDESDKITMTLKVIDGQEIHHQKEICLQVDSFKKAESLLTKIGCRKKSFQESKREIWQLDDVEICLDEWPFLEPFVEIEGQTEEAVKQVAAKLGFDYKEAVFDSVDILYSQKYNIPREIICSQVPKITFDMPENPLLKLQKIKD